MARNFYEFNEELESSNNPYRNTVQMTHGSYVSPYQQFKQQYPEIDAYGNKVLSGGYLKDNLRRFKQAGRNARLELQGQQPETEDNLLDFFAPMAMTAGKLPMDEISRLARAKDMGFDDADYYKGMYPYDWTKETATSKGPEITEINRTTEFPSFGGEDGGVHGIAGFITKDKEVANRFTSTEGAVYPLRYKSGKEFIIDAKGRNAGDIQFGEQGKPFRDVIRSGKYDTIKIINTVDEGDVIVALKPENIRSRFAKFDPTKKSSGNLLAGGLLGAIGLGAYDEQR